MYNEVPSGRWRTISPSPYACWLLAAPALLLGGALWVANLLNPPIEPVSFGVGAAILCAGLIRAWIWDRHCRRDQWQISDGAVRLVRGESEVLKVGSNQIIRCGLTSHRWSLLMGYGDPPYFYIRFITDDSSIEEEWFMMYMPSVFQAGNFRRAWTTNGMPHLGS